MQQRSSISKLLFSICLVLIGLITLGTGLNAQRKITLEECIDIAIENSFDARIAREQLRASEANAESARKALYSNVNLSFDVPDYYQSLNPEFNTETGRTEYFPQERLTWTGRLNIDQPIIWTNSRLSVSGMVHRQDQSGESVSSRFSRDFYTNVALVFTQPLFVANSQSIALRRAELDYGEALADFRRNTFDIVYQVTEAFYNLYSSQQQVQIQGDRVQQQNESYTTAQRKFKSGLIAEVEALQFEVDLASAQNDQFSADNTSISLSNSFKLLVGLDQSAEIELVLTDTTFTSFPIDPQKAVGEAKRTLVDLQRARNNIVRNKLSLEEVESRRRIRGDITLSYGFSNNDEQLNQLFVDTRDTRGAKFTLSVPVFDWGKHGEDVQAAKARLQTAELQAQRSELRVEQEILDLVRKIKSAAKRVEVLFKSRLIAEKANDINTKRFEIGTISSTDLAQSQSRLLQARLSALEALIDYNVSLADLTRKTSYDFELDQPVTLAQ
jgi:outer membrane protein